MTARSLFWVPVFVRFLLIWCAGFAGWYVWNLSTGLAISFAVLTLLVIVQLRHMYQLSLWLDKPEDVRLGDGWGAWTEIFAKLYRLRRDDERSRNELDEWLSRFRQAMSQLPDGVVIMDDVLLLEWCNPVAERHLGLSMAKDKGMRVTNLVRSPEFIDYIILGRYEEPLSLYLGERKLIVRLIPFENRRQILVTHDVTDMAKIEQMRRDFIANASHELRTPLTVITGFLEIAQTEPDLDPEVRERHLRLMVDQGQRMQNLVDDMLVLTRLESLDYPVRDEVVDMHYLLEQVRAEGEALSAGRHNVRLEFNGPRLKGSQDELRSAIGNLVSNAVRYSPAGGDVTIRWMGSPQGPYCSVSDTGIGIKQEHIARLTERFYRVDKGRSCDTQGTGLGLAIVKHIVARHDAQLRVESEAGKGSTFTIQFPALAKI